MTLADDLEDFLVDDLKELLLLLRLLRSSPVPTSMKSFFLGLDDLLDLLLLLFSGDPGGPWRCLLTFLPPPS